MHSEEVLLFIDGLYRLRYVSRTVEVLGYSVKELTGRSVDALMPQEDLEQLKTLIEARAAPRAPVKLQVQLLNDQREKILYDGTFTDHTDDVAIGCHVLLLRRAGDPVVNADLPTYNRPGHTATGSAESSVGVQRTIANLTEGFFTLDHDSRFIACNPITERLARTPREQLLGRCIWEVFPVDQTHPLYELLNSVMVNKVAGSSKIFSTTYNSWFTVRAFPHAKGISVIHNDVGAGQKKNEDLLLANERYLRATQLTDEAHWDWDPLTNDVQWGDGFLRQFGYDAAALAGNIELLYQMIHPEDMQRLIGGLQHAFEDPTLVVWEDNFRLKRADGEYVLVRSRGSVIRDENNTPIRVVGSLCDISKEHEASLKKDLLHRITHAMNASIEMEHGLDQVLQLLCGHTKYKAGEFWLLDELEKTLGLGGAYVSEECLRPFIDELRVKQIFPGEGLPGVAWQQKEFIHWKALGEHSRFIRKDVARSIGILEGLAFPVIHGDGKVLAMITLYADRPMHFHEGDHELLEAVALQVAPEIKKRRAENELKSFFSLTKDLLCIVDLTGQVRKINPAFNAELGWKVEEILGRHFLELVHPDDRATATQQMARIDKEYSVPYYENRIRCADGSYRWYAWTTTVLNRNGTIYCTGKDITGKKEDESRLSEITQRMFDFKESITDALCMFDPDWKFTYVNHECQKLLRRSYGELMDQSLWEMFPEAKGTEFERQYREASNSGKAVHFESYFPPLALWCEVHAYPSLSGLSVFFRDITEARTQQAIRQLERTALEQNMSRQSSLVQILDELLLGLEGVLPEMLCSILQVDHDRTNLMPLSSPSLPAEYVSFLKAVPVGEGIGSCGTAAYRKSSVVITDIAQSEFWKDFRHVALSHGLRACWSFPLLSSSGELLGTFASYFKTVRAPEDRETDLAMQVAQLIAALIESRLTEEVIHLSNERYELVSKATNDATWDWDLSTDHFHWGERTRELFGHDISGLTDITSWTGNIHPEDKDLVLKSIRKVLDGRKTNKWASEYRYIKADGRTAHVLDRGYVMRNASGEPLRMVGAMQDITQQKEQEEALRELNADLDQIVQDRTEELLLANSRLQYTNTQITDSIRYAKRIQQAILPRPETLRERSLDAFCVDMPRDLLSGDFYWQHSEGGRQWIAVADCTGHGVPGAMMSIIGHDLFNRAVTEHRITDPGSILDHVDLGLDRILRHGQASANIQDGMDVALCMIDKERGKITFAGALRPLFILTAGANTVKELPGNRSSLGPRETRESHYMPAEIPYAPGDRIFLTTDGFYSQFGGSHGKKVLKRRFLDLLVGLDASASMEEQGAALIRAFHDWKGPHEQVDDVMVIGIRL